jgi:hypothetical protein
MMNYSNRNEITRAANFELRERLHGRDHYGHGDNCSGEHVSMCRCRTVT